MGGAASFVPLVLVIIGCCIQATLLSIPAEAADADPIQDFCVADLSNKNLFINGLPCKAPSSVVSEDFRSTLFRGVGNTSNPLGIAIGFAAAATYPALNTQGLSILRIDYAASGGIVPPHVHPRSSEIVLVQEGAVLVGFIDTSGNYFSTTLYSGDLFVFPRGLVHFQLGLNSSYPSLSFSSFNSQNPGLSLVASALFASTPGIPNIVLQKTFSLTEPQVLAIKKAFGG